jgi:tetratricopeptide (TPR) repeat protein
MRREKEVSRLLENNQFEEALLLAEQYLKNDPDNPRLLEQAARAYTEMGDLTRAKDYLEKVIKADQDASEPYRQLAAIYERQSDLPEAMNMLRLYSLKEQNYLPREKAKRRIKDLERMQRKSDMQKAAAQAQANRAASQAASPKPEPAAPEKPKTETPAANPARPPSRAIEVPRPVGDLKAITTGRYDTSKMPPAQRLCCAQYFSDQADNIRALDPAGADFLYAQADKVRLGQMADVECKCP